jgi:hypothetical protein
MPDPIWSYWEGKKPPFIDLCLQTSQRVYGDRFRLVTPKTLSEYLDGSEIHENWKQIPFIACKAACIRVALVHKYGGWWHDADTVALKPRTPVLRKFTFTYWNRGRVLNGYFGAPINDPVMDCWLESINKVLARIQHITFWWAALGESLVTPCMLFHGGKRVPRKQWLPFDFSRDPEIFLRPIRPKSFQQMLRSSSLIGLNHSWLAEHAKKALLEPPGQQARSDLLIHRILTKAREIAR